MIPTDRATVVSPSLNAVPAPTSKEAQVQLSLITASGVLEYAVTAADDLLNRADGVLWLDIPT